jgi:hypothetical protein
MGSEDVAGHWIVAGPGICGLRPDDILVLKLSDRNGKSRKSKDVSLQSLLREQCWVLSCTLTS